MSTARQIVEIIPNDDDYRDLVIDTDTLDTPVAYADFIARLQEARRILDGCQWVIGDELIGAETAYGKHTMEEIADAIGVSPSSLYSWHGMALFWPADTRAYYIAKGMTYTHLRTAKSLGDFARACEFLDECVLYAWPPRYAETEMKKRKGQPVPPPAVYRGMARVIHGALVADDFVFQEGRVYVIQVRETL